MAFVHLHVHSHFSLLDGLAKVPDLINKAKEMGQEAIALTDHGAMYGVIEFYRAAQAAEIKPIIGAEIYIAPRAMTDKEPKLDTRPYHLTVLAKNEQGYRNLMKLVSEGHLTGFYYKPRIDKALLRKHAEGLIALSGCPAAEIPRLLQEGNYQRAKVIANNYITIFGQENFFFEIQPHPEIPEQALTNKGILKLSEELKIPLVATNDTHYINLKDKQAHEVLLAIQTGRDIDDQTRLTMQATDLHLASEQEMRGKLPDLPQAIENTVKVAELCNLTLPFGQLILPHFEVPTKQNALDYLRTQVEKGFAIRYGKGTSAIRERLEYELEVIGKTGFAEYFLIVADIVNWAKGRDIWVGPGRGSAAGSIVSYCLNITDLDPIHYRLLFERFLNPERIAPPDIDLDFADDRRDEVIAYIVKKYGHDRVGQIITFGVMKARLATRDVTRALGYPYALGDRIAKLVPFGSDLEQGIKQVPELMALYNQDPSAKKVIDMSFQLEGVVRHASTHAAGVVISKEPLVNYTPLQRSTTGEGITTQYSMYDVEAIGLLKMDILGLTNLTILKRCRDFVERYYGVTLELKNIPLDDKETYRLLSSAETIGVFQLESDGMRRYIKELKPTNIEDIMAMISLYRPGPMEFIPDYIAGKHGKRKPTYLHPKLEPILKDTYGIAVYQEQVLQIARDIAGFSLGEADVLRKAIGKKIKKLLLEQRKKFIDGAMSQGVAKAIAEKLFDFTEPFARYGFNRSHGAGYALIAYWTAYFKAHYPDAFMASLLTSEASKQKVEKLGSIVAEGQRLGLKVLLPDVNASASDFTVETKGQIRYGLSAIKNVGGKAAEAIVAQRSENGRFDSLADLITRLPQDVVNKKVVESLACAGALDSLAERNQVLSSIDTILQFAGKKSYLRGQESLFGAEGGKMQLRLAEVAPATNEQKLSWEKEYLGYYFSASSIQKNRNDGSNISKIAGAAVGDDITVTGIISGIKPITTRSGAPMGFVTLEDETHAIEVVVFPRLWQERAGLLESGKIVQARGRFDQKDGQPKLLAEDILEPSTAEPAHLKIIITNGFAKDHLVKLKELLAASPGDVSVALEIKSVSGVKNLTIKERVAVSDDLLSQLQLLLGEDNVVLDR
ncbi:MAG: DNA polymerase III subunit alpha [Patescibacteria group bacterium]